MTLSTSGTMGGQIDNILASLDSGNYIEPTWIDVSIIANNHIAIYKVSNDVLKVDDGIRINVCQRDAQVIADKFNCIMPTIKLADEIWLQATKHIDPIIHYDWVRDGTMGLAYRTQEQSKLLDDVIGYTNELVADVSKDWVITNLLWTYPGTAINYGWRNRVTGKPIQPPGGAHDIYHADYSQMLRLIRRTVNVDGDDYDVLDVAQSPELCKLISHEGVLKDVRLPDSFNTPGGGGSHPVKPLPPGRTAPTGSQGGSGLIAAAAGAVIGFGLTAWYLV